MSNQLSMDRLQKIIGEEATNKLLQEAQGMIIYVTNIDKASRATRDAAIRNTYHSNDRFTYDDVGKMYGLSGERVRQIVNRKHP